MTRKEIHDALLAWKPSDADHDSALCDICVGAETAANHTGDPEGGSVKTYTEDEFKAATAALEARVQELESVRQTSEIDAKVAEVKAEAEAQVADLQTQLDAAVLAAEKAKSDHEGLVKFLDETATADAEAAAREARKSERVAQVAEVASFPEDYVTANADRWASMTDEAFVAAIEDWKLIGAKKADVPLAPASTAMVASRGDAASTKSVLREVLDLRFKGIDARTVR